MNYGPELVGALVPELREYCGCQLQRVEAGGDWCVLTFKNKGALFFTWNPEIFGICSVTPDDLRELRGQSLKTPFALGLQRHFGGGAFPDGARVREAEREAVGFPPPGTYVPA